MKKLKVLYLLLFALLLSSVTYSQQRAVTSIQQNINEDAHGLEQKLNFTLDTLTLRSTSDILRVTFLDHGAKDSHIIDVGAKEIKIPLYHFKKGRYTIAVYTHDKIIALGANRLNDIPVPNDAIADLEESILRASLSEDQLVSRNIKPRKKKVNTTYDNNTRVTTAKPKRTVKEITKRKPKVKDSRVVEVKPKREVKEKRVVEAKPKRAVKETRVAEAKPKRVIKEKAPKPKRNIKKTPKTSNGKSALAIALEKREREKTNRAAAKKKEFTKIKSEKDLALNEVADESVGTLLTIKKVTYNLSKVDNDESIDKQSRAEYRKNNLRPNGMPYGD